MNIVWLIFMIFLWWAFFLFVWGVLLFVWFCLFLWYLWDVWFLCYFKLLIQIIFSEWMNERFALCLRRQTCLFVAFKPEHLIYSNRSWCCSVKVLGFCWCLILLFLKKSFSANEGPLNCQICNCKCCRVTEGSELTSEDLVTFVKPLSFHSANFLTPYPFLPHP